VIKQNTKENMIQVQRVTEKKGNIYRYGEQITIEGGIFGRFEFFVGIEEYDQYDENGCYERRISYGVDSPVSRNGKYFLPWWLSHQIDLEKSEAEIIASLIDAVPMVKSHYKKK
jgi:hypothetical protein